MPIAKPLLPTLILLYGSALSTGPGAAEPTPAVAVAPQYDSTHVYLAPEDVDRFIASFTAVFGGAASKPAVVTVTPTPSSTVSRVVFSPVGFLSVFRLQHAGPLSVRRRTHRLSGDRHGCGHRRRSHGRGRRVGRALPGSDRPRRHHPVAGRG